MTAFMKISEGRKLSCCIRGRRPRSYRLARSGRNKRKVAMKALGKKLNGLRLERMQASALWGGDAFRNVHPVLPKLRDPDAASPTVSDFLCGGERRVPQRPLPSTNPTALWSKPPTTGLRATWLGHSTVLIEID